MEFSQKLKDLMRARDLSAYKMANDLHCSQTTIRNWADGKTTPQPRTIIQLCEYFGVSEEELIGGAQAQKNNPDVSNDAEVMEMVHIFSQLSASTRSKLLELARLYSDAEHKNSETE